MRHIDLFSGIGGFALAAREVWEDQYENVLFCDNNKFCQEVLKKNFGKDVLIYDDIREVTADSAWLQQRRDIKRAIGERVGLCDQAQIDLLTGGFPCQPFSQAGKRRGTSDNRYLWPEMLRVIREFKPTWVVVENVRGLLTIEQGMVFEQVCLDLEGEGYEVQAFIIPAVAVNAPHRRDRVWIVALHSASDGFRRAKTDSYEEGYAEKPCQDGKLERGLKRPHSNDPDTEIERGKQPGGSRPRWAGLPDSGWYKNWLEVATELRGVDDGLPAELDGFKLTKSGHRVERLKALGNAIVPQVAVEIFRAINAFARE